MSKNIVILFIVFILLILLLVKSCDYSVEKAGGIRQIIVETGREIKSIEKEINKGK